MQLLVERIMTVSVAWGKNGVMTVLVRGRLMGPRNLPIQAQVLDGVQGDAFEGMTVPLRVAASLLGISTYTLNLAIADGVFVPSQHDGSQYRFIALTRVLAVRRQMLFGAPTQYGEVGATNLDRS
ncbi:hypothetical protein QMK19_23295 [Streptomyces sp. H10-C2]|uniref:hypothetical protein n=1 Tax=unclassified Streptomyces TaxID=2593676 RepID=UPI0024BAD095|nr:MULTISPECIES: hypothetical protein [unclassified Streptomyces]MDJ0342833.1 hypothetical protein [Streptomyces sp. PH10-H1]MDJ0372511.1 hypothetical protein [Streptomyces sp. H10-C2]